MVDLNENDDYTTALRAARLLLESSGDDISRGGLEETPGRFAKAWNFWTSGYGKDPKDVLKTFDDGACSEMVFQGNINVWSLCEHHLAPFFGVAHIGYIPNGKIIGLSKFYRLAEIFARRLQVQERLTTDIADALVEHLEPLGVGVVLRCRHSCMESRGIQKAGGATITSALRGAMKDESPARAEFLRFVEMADGGRPL